MSRLNAGAFEFVPGRSFKVPQAQPQAPPPQPIERPQQNEAPAPAPTISLNIGGTRPPAPITRDTPAEAPAPAPTVSLNIGSVKPAPAATPQPPKPKEPAPPPHPVDTQKPAAVSASVAAPSAKTFTTDRAKTDVTAVARDVQAAADEQTLKDLFGHTKEHLNIVFIGHVDAGKSTMGGNLLYICGMVDKRTMEKYEREAKEAGRESWYLSWALDSTPQERAKGKTVEVGRAYFETDARRYTILDAPGHKTFVPSMISGAAQADVAILVISARKGEFETGFEKGGQTREHIMLVKTAGVSKLVIAVNKMDEPTVQWDQTRFNEIKDKLTPFIKMAGFNPKTDVTFIPVSAYTGANLKERLDKKVCPWYTGPSFLEHLDNMPMVDRKINAPLMMPISEKYKDMGTIVVGKIESGHMRKGDTLILMPNKVAVEVAGINNEMEDEIEQAFCGDNVRARLRGIDDEDISPGFVLTSPGKPVHAVRQFEAQLAILDHKNIICAGYTAVMHIHTLAEEVTLSKLLHYFDKATGRKSKKPPQFAKRGQKIVALIETALPVCVERFADYPQLGRFTLRDEGKTIAIGKITKLIEAIDEVAEGVAQVSVS
ncbi:eukaryotic polypeptide chain release factor 3 [Punctularia strigosozonata HHB-11173 SS5]|uniref:eukaryotic polypeptide chain release factor 3 n=1 Tax=Punctularia strigosozonata (strain HHB-11173) TaxID=741275 RepID=UPI0004417498|nr:eukaryotic polypeptide chain release factor 3 [Punctularia strigosozonata HHB-11173 SS5]EIN10765.1 eukaryotic polypeptide chain release factor 3 [Punctularia strigosozonata HHB-11173 SS5]